MTVRSSRRWDVALAVALLAGATGVAVGNTAVFLSATVGFTYAVYGYASRPPAPALDVRRELSDPEPVPGDEVEVTVTVANVGDAGLPDVRVVDGAPATLSVTGGSPRHATSLRAGETASFTYTLPALRGDHEFDETVVICRNTSGASAVREVRRIGTPITCRAAVETPPLADQTVQQPGRIATDTGGEGIEFHSNRQYYPGDPMRRINWKRYASTRELSTVEFRESRAATVMVLVDARRESRIVRRPDEPDGVELATYGALRIAESLMDRNDRVGAALYAPRGAVLSPSADDVQRVRIRRLLEEGPESFEDRVRLRTHLRTVRTRVLRKHLSTGTQVVFLTPLLGDIPMEAAKRLAAYGHAVTIVSPDLTATDSPGGTIAGLERARRLAALRSGGVGVVDWSPDRPLDAATELTMGAMR